VTRLHTTTLGEQGSPVVFCHGLFGQGKNWTQVAKQLAADHRVVLVDMPNHGRSEWTDGFDYVDAAETVAQVLEEPVALVGHSMGGKIAMLLALLHPDLVERLCVVDVSPVTYHHHDEFRRYLDAMIGMDLSGLERRADAEEALAEAVPNRTVRSFLLQNLRRDGDSWRWQPNLEVFRDDLDVLGGWPADRLDGVAAYDGPVLWIGGAESRYVTDDHVAAMDELFPLNRRVTVKGAGHWVHSEQPEVFTEVLRRFVDAR
jgi:pimeloyl-ACP methyl ester carboxylesterase